MAAEIVKKKANLKISKATCVVDTYWTFTSARLHAKYNVLTYLILKTIRLKLSLSSYNR